MTTALAWTTVALGALGGMVAAMTLVGWTLPRGHVATRSVGLPVPPAVAWQVLADFPGQTAWRRGLSAVERLPDAAGGEVWRERHGRHAVAFRTTQAEPPSRLVRRVADEQGPIRGAWEFSIRPEADPATCRVTLTERGEVDNPCFRFVNRFVVGQAATLEGYLRDLAAKFGADPTLDTERQLPRPRPGTATSRPARPGTAGRLALFAAGSRDIEPDQSIGIGADDLAAADGGELLVNP